MTKLILDVDSSHRHLSSKEVIDQVTKIKVLLPVILAPQAEMGP